MIVVARFAGSGSLRLCGACECNHEIGQKSQSLSHLFFLSSAVLVAGQKTGFVSWQRKNHHRGCIPLISCSSAVTIPRPLLAQDRWTMNLEYIWGERFNHFYGDDLLL